MELKDRIVIINEKNMKNFTQLHKEMSTNDLERIVNNHIAVAIDEIKEDQNNNKMEESI